MKEEYIVGITGASGGGYAVTMLGLLMKRDVVVHLVVSEAGEKVLAHELGFGLPETRLFLEGMTAKNGVGATVRRYEPDELFAPIASGSYRTDGMAVIPCSMKTLAAVASGYASNLIERAADVTLKERRPLVLVVRETPLNRIHLENMLRAHNAGATIMPASPGFYSGPKTIADIREAIAVRVLDRLGIEMPSSFRWQGVGSESDDELQ